MEDSTWLVFNAKGIVRSVKGRRSRYSSIERPSLARGEYACLVTVSVPDSVFKAAPLPEAVITVPESAVVAPRVTVEVSDIPPGAADHDEASGL